MSVLENLSRRHVGLPLTLFFLYVSFISSLIYEYQLKFLPSHLCLAQRYCTVVCIACVTIAFIARNKTHIRFIDFSCISLFWGACFSGYHLLIQYGILPEMDFLKKPFFTNESSEEIANKVSEVISCANLEPSVFGIPTTAFTFILFVFLFIYLSSCFRSKNPDAKNS